MKLIPNWRHWWRFWSVRLQLAGIALMGAMSQFPDVFGAVWLAMPSEVRSTLPPWLLSAVAYSLLVGGVGARLIRQERLH